MHRGRGDPLDLQADLRHPDPVNLDAPHNLFVTILAVSAAGLVAATAYEADVFAPRPPGPAAAPPALAVPDEGEVEIAEAEILVGESDRLGEAAVEDPAPTEPEEAGAVAEPADEPAPAEPDPVAPAAPVVPPEADDGVAWAPLREGTRSEPCLVWANRALMATGLSRREPVGTDGPFTANGEPLVVFMDFANSTGVSQEVTVVWTHGESGVTHIDTTEAGTGSRWRTWVERPFALDELGPWTVQLVDAERCQIADVSFELVAPDW